jgi:hypothetical protein
MLLTPIVLAMAAGFLVVIEAVRRAALGRLFERSLLRVAAADPTTRPDR